VLNHASGKKTEMQQQMQRLSKPRLISLTEAQDEGLKVQQPQWSNLQWSRNPNKNRLLLTLTILN